jgi:AcrR family transcriptional regulator
VSRQAERSEATRAKLIAAARKLFARRGYGDVGTEEIVTRAKVTRGALYHHFEDKRDLFRAVHEQVEAELTETIATQLAAAGAQDPIEVLIGGMRIFLDACTDPELQRVALMDAPAVLGWAEWRSVEERYGLGLVSAALEMAIESGSLRPQPVRPLAHVLLAAMSEAGMLIATADDPEATRDEVESALIALLEGLRS